MPPDGQTSPWDEADCTVDEALVAGLVASQTALRPTAIRYVNAGWDSWVWAVEAPPGTWMFRFPKRAEVAVRLERERALLPRLTPVLPLAVPRFEVIGRPAFGYPHPFVGYRRLPGRPAMDVGETLLDVRSGGERLGVFLAALHGFPPHEARRLGVEEDAPDQAYDDETSDGASSLLAAVAPVLPAEVVARARGLLAATPPPARELALVHTDFFPEHLLVDAGAPSGVIDWGDVALGDPAVDLAGLAYCGGAPLLAAGLDVYCRLRALGPEEAAALALRARRGAVFRALDDLSYGRGAGRPAYVEMALRALGRV